MSNMKNLLIIIMTSLFLVNCNNNVDKQGFLRYQPPPCLWRQKDRAVYSLSEDNATALVPRDVRNIIDSQVYDFSYIEKTENIMDKMENRKSGDSGFFDAFFGDNS